MSTGQGLNSHELECDPRPEPYLVRLKHISIAAVRGARAEWSEDNRTTEKMARHRRTPPGIIQGSADDNAIKCSELAPFVDRADKIPVEVHLSDGCGNYTKVN